MNKYLKITLLSIGHLFVDLCSVYLINSFFNVGYIELALYFLIYNLIAFAFQPIVGYVADKYNLYRYYLIVGLSLPLLMLLIPSESIILIIIATLGNAMYHVGGGVVSLNLFPNKVAPAGVFVAPGAIGVFLGVTLSNHSYDYSLLIALISFFIVILLYLTFKFDKEKQDSSKVSDHVGTITLLIFIIVLIRGLIGLNIQFPWQSDLFDKTFLILGIVIGKFVGGILADRYGLFKIGLFGLMFSIPFIIFGYYVPVLGMIGALFFNVTMAITLFIIVYSLGKYKGFAFGITTLALFVSYVPKAFGFTMKYNSLYVGLIITLSLVGSFLLYKVVKLFELNEGEF